MNLTHRETCLVGVGARTPVGLSAASTAAAVRAGVAGMRRHDFMVDQRGAPMIVGMDAKLPVDVMGVERLVTLAVPAAIEALTPMLDNPRCSGRPLSVLIALPEQRPGWNAAMATAFAKRFESMLRAATRIDELSCTTTGHAGGIVCMQRALSLIDAGQRDLCLVGGVDSYMEPETLEWLDQLEQLHSENNIWGFCPSEAAGFCLLASRSCADRLGLSRRIKLLSTGVALEENKIKTDTVCIGRGLGDAISQALLALPSPNERVDHTICDMNGEPYRGDEFGFAMLRAAEWLADGSDFDTPADCWGDVGAASGPLFVNLAAFAALKGYATGTLTLVWASSEGGLRGAMLLQAAHNAN